jgi:LysR family transcriptional regulator, transcriptional activator of nhaA
MTFSKKLNMSNSFNYKHLYYFWVVAKEGGMSRASDKLDIAVQTVSAQVRELERSLGYALLKPAGRGLALTDAGITAMQLADQIFQIGENLPTLVRDAASVPTKRLAIGISDGLPKLVVRRLLNPVIAEPNLRLLCHEGELEDLLGDLALHRLDVVFSDRPAPVNPNIKLYSHAMGSSPMAWYATPSLIRTGGASFPRASPTCPCSCPPPILRCVPGWTTGLNTSASGHASQASLRTAPCSTPLGPAAWAYSRQQSGPKKTCWRTTASSVWAPVKGWWKIFTQ